MSRELDAGGAVLGITLRLVDPPRKIPGGAGAGPCIGMRHPQSGRCWLVAQDTRRSGRVCTLDQELTQTERNAGDRR